MTVQFVAVIGAGQMGSGIAQVCAQAGYQVWLYDLCGEVLEKSLGKIQQSWVKLAAKGKLTNERVQSYTANLHATTSLSRIESPAIVIEAISEILSLKQQLYQEIADYCTPDTIMASNTSSLSITRLAEAYRYPQNFVGLHFMNPVPLMELVEVIKGEKTNDQIYHKSLQFITSLNKTPVTVQDYPGFVLNRLLLPMINEAVYCLMEGVGEAQDIDQIMILGARHPMGPLALADLIGLDTCLAILETLYQGFADPKYRPCPLLKRMVAAGFLGQKSGRGFYAYK